MIIKSKHIDHDQIAYLNELLAREIPQSTKERIERELRTMSSGAKGEKDTAYYMDFHFKDTRNWALIHDLRIEHKGRVAQIDHLLIGRMLDIYVVESKNFNSGVSINEHGEFCYFYKNKPCPMPSPIEQNNRHIQVLQQFLAENNLLPRRIGFQIAPTFRNYILISPTSRLTKPSKGTYDTSMVMKADQFVSRFNKETEEMTLSDIMNLSKVISQDSLLGFAKKVAAFHKPLVIDYKSRFGLEDGAQPEQSVDIREAGATYQADTAGAGPDVMTEVEKPKEKSYFCAACRKPITEKVAVFCFKQKQKFGGRAYCFDCQKQRLVERKSN